MILDSGTRYGSSLIGEKKNKICEFGIKEKKNRSVYFKLGWKKKHVNHSTWTWDNDTTAPHCQPTNSTEASAAAKHHNAPAYSTAADKRDQFS